ncbi:unnamed protein product [Effrenium voratum]|nr:unnamed protein product [Effrenium voratum]
MASSAWLARLMMLFPLLYAGSLYQVTFLSPAGSNSALSSLHHPMQGRRPQPLCKAPSTGRLSLGLALGLAGRGLTRRFAKGAAAAVAEAQLSVESERVHGFFLFWRAGFCFCFSGSMGMARYGSKLTELGQTAGFSLWFHLPRRHFGITFSSHSKSFGEQAFAFFFWRAAEWLFAQTC